MDAGPYAAGHVPSAAGPPAVAARRTLVRAGLPALAVAAMVAAPVGAGLLRLPSVDSSGVSSVVWLVIGARLLAKRWWPRRNSQLVWRERAAGRGAVEPGLIARRSLAGWVDLVADAVLVIGGSGGPVGHAARAGWSGRTSPGRCSPSGSRVARSDGLRAGAVHRPAGADRQRDPARPTGPGLDEHRPGQPAPERRPDRRRTAAAGGMAVVAAARRWSAAGTRRCRRTGWSPRSRHYRFRPQVLADGPVTAPEPVDPAGERWVTGRTAQSLYSLRRPREMMVFWISEVPSPMSRNGASRISRSISYSLE